MHHPSVIEVDVGSLLTIPLDEGFVQPAHSKFARLAVRASLDLQDDPSPTPSVRGEPGLEVLHPLPEYLACDDVVSHAGVDDYVPQHAATLPGGLVLAHTEAPASGQSGGRSVLFVSEPPGSA